MVPRIRHDALPSRGIVRPAPPAPRLSGVLVAALLLFPATEVAHANAWSPVGDLAPKEGLPLPARPRVDPPPGDVIESALEIPGLPWKTTGNTCDFNDDYDEVCPYTGSTSPDIVFHFRPGSDVLAEIDLCASGYDTKVYVYAGGVDSLVACNDDAACGVTGYQSALQYLNLEAGSDYYLVVDGYLGDCGEFELTIAEMEEPWCPPGAVNENEPPCHDGYVDETNGGCDADPSLFQEIGCGFGEGVSWCGEYGGFERSGQDDRDTDWYWIDRNCNYLGNVRWCMQGAYSTTFGYVIPGPCDPRPEFVEWRTVDPLERGCIDLPAGTLWLGVMTSGSGSSAGPCGGEYVMFLENYVYPPLGIESSSWGRIKAEYRTPSEPER